MVERSFAHILDRGGMGISDYEPIERDRRKRLDELRTGASRSPFSLPRHQWRGINGAGSLRDRADREGVDRRRLDR
jgi:hypothetical protein